MWSIGYNPLCVLTVLKRLFEKRFFSTLEFSSVVSLELEKRISGIVFWYINIIIKNLRETVAGKRYSWWRGVRKIEKGDSPWGVNLQPARAPSLSGGSNPSLLVTS